MYGGNLRRLIVETRQLYRSLKLNERAVDMPPHLEPRKFHLHQPDAGILERLSARLDPPMLALIGDPRKNADVDLFREMWPVGPHRAAMPTGADIVFERSRPTRY